MEIINKRKEKMMIMDYDFLINILLEDKPSDYFYANEERIFKLIPELKECKNFNQNNPWHIYDVYEHILHVIDGVPNNIILRMAALFHDIGKPLSYQEDENGVGHFWGHWEKSKEIFDNFANRYNMDKNMQSLISNLILYHDLNIAKASKEELECIISTFDKNGIKMLFQLKKSDLLAQNEKYHYMLENYSIQEAKVLAKVK